MNTPSNPYRQESFDALAQKYCDERIEVAVEARMKALQEKLYKEMAEVPRDLGDNVLYYRIWACLAIVVLAIIGAVLANSIHNNKTEVAVWNEKIVAAHEVAVQREQEAVKADREAAKAMWDHMNVTAKLSYPECKHMLPSEL